MTIYPPLALMPRSNSTSSSRLVNQLQAIGRASREWTVELKRGWEVLDLRPYSGYDDYLRSLSRKQRWKIRRAAREVEAANIGVDGRPLGLRHRLRALPILWSHAWRLNESIPHVLIAFFVESVAVLSFRQTIGWFEQERDELVAVVSCLDRPTEVNLLVFAQRAGYERAWLWWHCIADVIRTSLEDDDKVLIKLGLNQRPLKRRSWNTRAQRQP